MNTEASSIDILQLATDSAPKRHAISAAGSAARIDYRHLIAMTDDTGMLQHAKYSIPDRDHGYCIDDNARALIVACQAGRLGGRKEIERLVPIYLAFINQAFNSDNRRFRNFMSYDRRWLEDTGSEDSQGRALWGLGVASVMAPLSSQRVLAGRLFEDGLPAVDMFQAPRARAFAILGINHYLQGNERRRPTQARLESLAGGLYDLFLCSSSDGWQWCEAYMTYDNAILPLALLQAGHRMGNTEMVEVALRALNWLIERQMTPDGHFSLIGNDGWMTRNGHRAIFDQQPLDAGALTLACAEAYRCTNEHRWLEHAHCALGWFMGRNDLDQMLYDPETGGCCDGLHHAGVNSNQGAESTLSWLMAWQQIEVPGMAGGGMVAEAVMKDSLR